MVMGRFDEKSNPIELHLKNFVKLSMVKGSDVAYHFIMTKRALKKTKMFLLLNKIVKIYVQLLLLLWFDSLEVKLNTIQDFLCELEMKPHLVLFSVENQKKHIRLVSLVAHDSSDFLHWKALDLVSFQTRTKNLEWYLI